MTTKTEDLSKTIEPPKLKVFPELKECPKINNLDIDDYFKQKVTKFFWSFVMLDQYLVLEYEFEKIEKDVLLVIKNLGKITKEDIDVLKTTMVQNGKKNLRYKLIKEMTIEKGVLYVCLKNSGEVKFKTTKEEIENEKDDSNINPVTIDDKKVIFYFGHDDKKLQEEFLKSDYHKKAVKIRDSLYSKHSLMRSYNRFSVEDNQYELCVENIRRTVDVISFFNRITVFLKENDIRNVTVIINNDETVSLLFDLRSEQDARNDMHRLDEVPKKKSKFI